MSIATLKRKTQTQYNNMSVGQRGFSLNGALRSSGYVGQDTLGRSLVRSLAGKNGELKGHGGCCGKYNVSQIKTSPEMSCLNDPTVVKSSSLNNTGLLMTKYRWIRRPNPYAPWKPSDYLNSGNQSTYIDNLARTTIAESCHDVSGNTTPVTCCTLPGSRSFSINWKKKNPITKPDSFFSGGMDQSEYIRKLDKKCGQNDLLYNRMPRKQNKSVPFACG